MTRDIGETAIIGELPEGISIAAAILTQLGDIWFLFLFLGVLYWFGEAFPLSIVLDRTRAAFAIALALGALTVTTAFKQWLRLPRPPAASEPTGIELLPAALHPLYVSMATADGFGFPSGHAVSAILVFGGLALLFGTRRSYAVGGLLVVLIPLSRLVLEVHYLVDVLVGLTIGGLYLAGVYVLCGRGSNPSRAMMFALLAALGGVVIAGYTVDTMAALGATLAARITWGSLGDAIGHEDTTTVGGVIATVVGLLAALLFVIVDTVEPEPYVAFLGIAVVVSVVIAAPLLGEDMARRRERRPN